MGEIKYRRAGVEDLDILVEWRMKFLQDFFKEKDVEKNRKLEDEIKIYLGETLPNDDYIAWLAEIDSGIVGIGVLAVYRIPPTYSIPNGKAGCILNIYTLPDVRKRGIASLILNKLIEEAKSKDIHFLHLLASAEGLSTYLKAGFKKIDNEYCLKI